MTATSSSCAPAVFASRWMVESLTSVARSIRDTFSWLISAAAPKFLLGHPDGFTDGRQREDEVDLAAVCSTRARRTGSARAASISPWKSSGCSVIACALVPFAHALDRASRQPMLPGFVRRSCRPRGSRLAVRRDRGATHRAGAPSVSSGRPGRFANRKRHDQMAPRLEVVAMRLSDRGDGISAD